MSIDDRPIGEDDLQAFIDDRLDRERRGMVEVWLGQRCELRGAIAADRKLREALRASLNDPADEPVPARLRLSEVRREVGRRRAKGLAVVAASVALLLIGGTTGWIGREFTQQPVVAMSDALSAYRVFALEPLRPVEVRAAEGTWLAQWLGERVGRPLNIPDLSGLGLRFMGGRLLSTDQGAAALLMYDNDGGSRIIVYVRPIEGTRPEGFFQRSEDNVDTYYWFDGRFGYAVIGPSEFGKLIQATQTIRRDMRGV